MRCGHSWTVWARTRRRLRLGASSFISSVIGLCGCACVVCRSPSEGPVPAIILATGYADAVGALRTVGDLKGKVVIDITNPLTADYMGLTLGHTTSAAEEIAKAVPGAEVVKAFNTMFAQVLAEGADFGHGRKAEVFVAGDSERARQTAGAIAESIGFAVVDVGGLKNARYLEPLAGLNIYLGYGAGWGTAIAPVWIRKA